VTPDSVASVARARTLAIETIALLRQADPAFPALTPQDLSLDLRQDWFEPGYGVVTPETSAAVAHLAARGLKIETTYTGKAVAAMLSDAASGALAGQSVLFWNTYSSAPMLEPGPVEVLPGLLREYLDQCDRLFGDFHA
jgi:1-aminocyclopropane-1-carboxylate deaminase/D-cysteine desulfhydrase-like pyridoxal-dependent ACC family enzyme